jgi:hypothetical protein
MERSKALNRKWGVIVLGIWLILGGLLPLLNLNFSGSGIVLAVLAIAAGGLLLIGNKGTVLSRSIGVILLAIWLIARGLLSLLDVTFPASETILAILAIAAGVLLLLNR